MNRRYSHTRPTPGRVGADDRPATPCAGRWDVYESLHGTNNVDREALEAARNMCGTCLLRNPDTARACLSAAEARGERWVQWVTGRRKQSPAQIEYQRRRKTKRAEAAAQRLADLRELVSQGADVEEACGRLGLSRDALWKWCHKWAREEFAALNAASPYGNQYRKVAPLTKPRRSRAKKAA